MGLQDFGGIAPNITVATETDFHAGSWVAEAKDMLWQSGAVVLRTPILANDGVEAALSQLSDDFLEDAFWSTPRSKVAGRTLTATEYPSPRTIPLHSEMAYMREWPRLVAFHSIVVAETGGETTICSVDAVSDSLDDSLLETFRDKGVMYRRTFQKRVDIPWQQAFQTESREEVEAIGQARGMQVEWLPGDVLSTSHTAQGTIDGEGGRPIFFNQAHLFHASGLEPNVRQALEKVYGAERLPRNAFYGDGSPIADADAQAVRDAFESNQTAMCWRAGDILLLDNFRYAHGRLPFSGPRKLHVSLAISETQPKRTPLFDAATASVQ